MTVQPSAWECGSQIRQSSKQPLAVMLIKFAILGYAKTHSWKLLLWHIDPIVASAKYAVQGFSYIYTSEQTCSHPQEYSIDLY